MDSTIEILKMITTICTAGIVAGIAYFYNRANLKLSHERLEKELFKEFNERYDKLNDSLEMLSLEMTVEELKLKDSKIERKTLHNVVIDYFNLCAEQYYWKDKKRISDKIWLAWSKGMMYYFEKFPVIRKLWEMESEKSSKKYE